MKVKKGSITDLILQDHSKETWETVARRAIDNPADLTELMGCFFSEDLRLIQRSSQCISKVHDINKTIISPYFPKMIEALNLNSINAYKRNVLRILQDADIPEAYHSKVFDLGLKFLLNKDEAIAITAFAMTVLRRICEQYPELSNEVIDTIQILLEEDPSPGVKNRGGHEIAKLKKLLEN